MFLGTTRPLLGARSHSLTHPLAAGDHLRRARPCWAETMTEEAPIRTQAPGCDVCYREEGSRAVLGCL